jgi:hypothetical protein
MFVHTDALGAKTLRNPGRVEVKLADNLPVRPGPLGWTPALLAACGFEDVPLVEVTRPTVTATQVATVAVQLVDGIPTQVWTVRDKTAEELAAEATAVNDRTIREQAEGALDTLQSHIDAPQVTFTTVAQAQTQMRQLQDAVRFQARVQRRLIRLALGLLDGTD